MREQEAMVATAAPVVIVGAGHSGVAVAAGLRARGWEGGILLLDTENEAPYERPPLSKDLLKDGASDESAVLRKEKFYQDKRIDRLAGSTAEAIDRKSKIFDRCWAFDVALRSPGLSEHLARIPALLGPTFTDGVATIAPLIIPFDL